MRNTLIIGVLCVLAIALGAWLYFMHPLTASAPAAQTAAVEAADISFNVLDSGIQARSMPSRANYAIYSADEFASFWKQAHDDDGTKPPAVDFTQNYVIGVFAGTEPTNNYSISVAKIVDEGTTRSVTVDLKQPGADCQTSTSPTSPYEFVSVAFSNAQTLTHTDEQVSANCPQ